MIEFFVKRPVTTIMFVLVFVVLGIVSFMELPIEETPKVALPIVTITTVYPGATPAEVETQVIDKIEDKVSELAGIDKIRSESYENLGFVYIEFDIKEDVNIKFIEVKDKVESILNDLPTDIDRPIVEKYDPLVAPVMELVLSGENIDSLELYEYADKSLKEKLTSISGVANVEIYGGKERQINITLDPELMRRYYVTIADVVQEISLKNKNIPGGLLEKDRDSVSIRFIGEFEDIEEIANMTISSPDGTVFKISDIGTVEDSFKKVDSIARFNSKEVVGLSLEKVSDGNAIEVARAVYKKLPDLNKSLPVGMQLAVASDTTETIISETYSTETNIVLGILLTVIILYMFTGRASSTFVAVVVIPISVISTMFLADMAGFTINLVTLIAIASALGTLIANAIIIIENVLVHLDKGQSPQEAAVNGTKEVTGAIFAAAGTNIVVFTPIAMMGGVIGKFMVQFGLTVVFATIFSIIASFSLTPMMCALLLRAKDKNKIEEEAAKKSINPLHYLVIITDKTVKFLINEYRRIFNLMFRHPKITLLIAVAALFSLRLIMPFIGNDFFAKYDKDEIDISLTMPQGSTIDKTLETMGLIEEKVATIPEVKSYLTKIGDNGVENAEMIVKLTPSRERQRSDKDIISSLVGFGSSLPDAEIHMMSPGTGLSNADITINVFGKDYDKLVKLTQDMKERMEQSGYFRSVSNSYKLPKKEIQFIPNQESLMKYDVQNSYIGYILRASVYGDDSNIYKEQGEEYDINVELSDKYTEDFQDLEQINIVSRKGLLPITEFGDLKITKALPTIRHRDGERVIQLEGYLSKSSSGQVSNILDNEFKSLLSEGYNYKYAGDAELSEESTQEISKAFILAVLLTYMLLCALMNSFLRPFAIILSVAVSFVGVFYAVFFMEQTINIVAMLAMVMLVGLVVNNSILLLDYTVLKLDEGLPVKEALWRGAEVKFKAILMTTIAIIGGVLPQLWSIDPKKASMGAVIIGGMVASFLFTFIFTPVVFWYLEKMVHFFTKKKV